MKKIKDYIYNIFIVVFIFILLPCIASQCIPSSKAYAGDYYDWKVFATGKIIDLDPMFENQFGLMIHFDTGAWATAWSSQFIKSDKNGWPSMNQTGTLYRMKDKNGEKWKWEKHALKTEPKTKPKPKLAPKVVIAQVENDWKNTSSLPEKNKVVVVKFHNDLTSTAYVNKYDEWKLDMNRNGYKGGRTLTNIKNWKDIGL